MSGGMILHSLISVIFELDASKKLKLGSFTGVWDGVLGFLLLVVCVPFFFVKYRNLYSAAGLSSEKGENVTH